MIYAAWGHREGNTGYWWAMESRNKKTLTWTCRGGGDRAAARRAVRCGAENFRLASWARLWAGRIPSYQPRLIMARITTFGRSRTAQQRSGFAAIGSAFGGLVSQWHTGPARRCGTRVYPDYLTGLFSAFESW
jgi:formyl-CoA transferase